MSRHLLLSLATLSTLTLMGSVAQAQSFTTLYDFTGAAGTQASTSAVTQPTNGAASVLDRGVGLTTNAGANSINSANWSSAGIDLTDFYGFTITPNAGFNLSLTTLAYTETRSGTGPQNFEIRSSVDGFAAALTGASYSNATTTANTARSFTLSTISALQNVAGPVTLRIYGFGSTSTAGTYRLTSPAAGQGLTLAGTFTSRVAAAPEPATLALLLPGMLLLGRRRRA